MLALLRRVSLRHLQSSKLRSLLVVVGIALGVALYVATEADADSVSRAFGELVTRIAGRADLVIEGSGSGVPTELVPTVAETKGVAHAAASLEVAAQAVDLHDSLLVLGVDLLGDLHFLPLESGRSEGAIEDPLSFVNDPSALLLSRRFAARHGLGTGSTLRLLTADGPKPFVVRGLLDDAGSSTSFGGQIAVMFLDAAQIAFARGELADRIDVALDKGADAEAVRATLQRQLGPAFAVTPPGRLGAQLRSLAAPLRAALFTSAFLALLVGGFLVYNAVSIAVAQRRHELGVLRTLGVPRGAATAMFCLEAGALALPGAALGLALGALLARSFTAITLQSIERAYAAVAQVAPHVGFTLGSRALLAGLAMAVLAAYWPARRGAALDPVVVLRGAYESRPTPLPLGRMMAGGMVLFALGRLPIVPPGRLGGALSVTLTVTGATLATPSLVLLLRRALLPLARAAGVPARIGLDYVARTLGRSSVNVLALIVAVSMSVSVGGWLASLEHAIASWARDVGSADLTVTQGSPILDRRHVALRPEAVERLANVAGIAALQRFRMIDQRIAGLSMRLVATELETFFQQSAQRGRGYRVLQGAPLAPGEAPARPRVLLSENAASRLHKSAGDTLVLPTPSGDLACEVRAVVVDYTSELGAIFIDRSVFLRAFHDDAVDGVFVYLDQGADASATANAIRGALSGVRSGEGAARETVFVTQTREVETHIVQAVRETFSYSRAVELMTLVIALMGVIGTMIAAVIDRKRELSMLRAIGATTLQVASAVVVESAFLGLCGAIGGAALGVLECEVFFDTLLRAQTGWHLELSLPWLAIARTGGLVVLTSALAGALPALRAARSGLLPSQSAE